MKYLKLTLAAFILAGGLLFTAPSAQARATFEVFYESLSPYGDWIWIEEFGYSWRPAGVGADWRPYADGYWAYTDAGWTWVSYEDWGWATYHYGRWAYLIDEGWFWVPGTEWAPAWVSWRYSDDYIGWAPLPPNVDFHHSVGISAWVDVRYDIGPAYYNFCPVRHFGAPVLLPVIMDRSRNLTIIQHTTNVTNISIRNSVIYNEGPRYDVVSRRSARPIERLRLERRRDLDGIRSHRTRGDGKRDGRLTVRSPEISPRSEATRSRPAKVEKRISKARVDRGWERVGNETERRNLRERFRQQAEASSDERRERPIPTTERTAADTQDRSRRSGAGREVGRQQATDQAPPAAREGGLPRAEAPRAAERVVESRPSREASEDHRKARARQQAEQVRQQAEQTRQRDAERAVTPQRRVPQQQVAPQERPAQRAVRPERVAPPQRVVPPQRAVSPQEAPRHQSAETPRREQRPAVERRQGGELPNVRVPREESRQAVPPQRTREASQERGAAPVREQKVAPPQDQTQPEEERKSGRKRDRD